MFLPPLFLLHNFRECLWEKGVKYLGHRLIFGFHAQPLGGYVGMNTGQ
jgi:hypothetical protein